MRAGAPDPEADERVPYPDSLRPFRLRQPGYGKGPRADLPGRSGAGAFRAAKGHAWDMMDCSRPHSGAQGTSWRSRFLCKPARRPEKGVRKTTAAALWGGGRFYEPLAEPDSSP